MCVAGVCVLNQTSHEVDRGRKHCMLLLVKAQLAKDAAVGWTHTFLVSLTARTPLCVHYHPNAKRKS